MTNIADDGGNHVDRARREVASGRSAGEIANGLRGEGLDAGAVVGVLVAAGFSPADAIRAGTAKTASVTFHDLLDRVKELDGDIERAGGFEPEALDGVLRAMSDGMTLAVVEARLKGAGADSTRALIFVQAVRMRRERPFRLLSPQEVFTLPDPEWQIDGLIGWGQLALIWGKPGEGKTFVALDWAASVATGLPWLGHDVRQGVAVYVLAEGQAGIKQRLRAWAVEHGVEPDDLPGPNFVLKAVNLLNPGSVAAFAAEVRDVGADFIVIDTLSRCLAGGDENGPKDMSRAVQACDDIREQTGATLLIVHHPDKGGNAERGHTALRGALDSSFELRRKDRIITLSNDKQKDAVQHSDITIETVEVGDSLVLRHAEASGSLYVDEQLAAKVVAAIREHGRPLTAKSGKKLAKALKQTEVFKHVQGTRDETIKEAVLNDPLSGIGMEEGPGTSKLYYVSADATSSQVADEVGP